MKFILCGVLYIFRFVVFTTAEHNETSASGNRMARIIDGSPTNIRNHPYQVSMRWTYRGNKHFCGGTIINKWYILTAAHCVDDKVDSKKYIRIVTGTSRSDIGGKEYSVRSITIHPDYDQSSTDLYHDIALVKLSEPIKFGPTVRPVRKPTKNIETGDAATVTGWGYKSHPAGKTPIYLQEASMTLLDSDECQQWLSFDLRSTQVCAIASGRFGTGLCTGDSGSPLVADGRLVGVASYVDRCGAGSPDVYTNVYPYLNFVKYVISLGL